MSAKIRLARAGRKGIPFYHLVVASATSARDGKFIELLGTYDPIVKEEGKKTININKERAEYWLSVGAQPTERASILLIKENVKGAEKYKPVFVPKEKQVKKDKKDKK